MSKSADRTPTKPRARSARYPGTPLSEAIEFTRQIAAKGVDGLPAEAIAAAMGYKNIRTHSISAGLSSSRQFGLITLRENGYALTDLAREILETSEIAKLQDARQRALLHPPLYAELCERFRAKRVPEAAALANWLQHNHQITPKAKLAAAEVFIASARDANALDDEGALRIDAASPTPASSTAIEESDRLDLPARDFEHAGHAVSFTLRLWGRDEGKTIRVSAPESISAASLERLLQALRLHVHVSDDPTS